MKHDLISLLVLPFTFVAIACGSSEPAQTTPTTPKESATAAGNSSVDDSEALATCNAMFVRQRECENFLPALVEHRVKHDVPEGIAARDAAEGREALLAIAREEWANDSTDEAIAATCEKIVSDTPGEDLEAMAPVAQGCLAETDCDPFVDCTLGLMSARWSR